MRWFVALVASLIFIGPSYALTQAQVDEVVLSHQKNIANAIFLKKGCDLQKDADQAAACRSLCDRAIQVSKDLTVGIREYKAQIDKNSMLGVLDAEAVYFKRVLAQRQLSAEWWNSPFFGRWHKGAGEESVFPSAYPDLLQQESMMRGHCNKLSILSILPCQAGFNKYRQALERILTSAQEVNRSREAGDKDAHLKAAVEEVRLRVEATELKAQAIKKHLLK